MIRMLLRVLGDAYATRIRRTITLMTITAIVEGASYGLLVPILKALLSDEPEHAWGWLIAFAATVAIYALLRYFSDLSGFRVATTLLHGMYYRIGDHLARLPVGWYSANRVGQVSNSASSGVMESMGVIAHLLAPFISAAVTPLTIVAVMFVFNWQLGLAALLGAPIVAVNYVWASKRAASADADRHDRGHEATTRVIEYLQAQPVLRAGGRSGQRFDLLDDSLRELQTAQRRTALASVPGVVGATVVVQLIFTVMLALGAYLALGGSIGVPEVLALLVLAARCADPLLSLSDIGGKLRSAHGELSRLATVLDTEPLAEPAVARRPSAFDVEFDAVSFCYDSDTVIDEVSLSIPAGRRMAIVGPSGAGKSTLLNLLARSYDVDAGAVRVGGVDVRDIGSTALMEQCAIVFQDVYLFDGTIADNVRLGKTDATDAEVEAAAAAARLDDVVASSPNGWSTTVGEGGADLSGGQRQRVAIARALLKDAPIVLLDEVTSALDPVNEAAVHAGIDELMRGRTVVMVAHRMATVRNADRIVFVDAGRVVEQGSHEELLALDGRYADYWRITAAAVA